MTRKYKRKWTYEKVLESAKKFNHIFDWELGDRNAYRAAKIRGWFKEATAHMTKKIRKAFTTKYTDDDIFAIALKFNTPREWYTESPSTYSIAHQRNIVGKATAHMQRQIAKAGTYTEEVIKNSALKYSSIKEWIQNEPKFYAAAWRQGLLNQVKPIKVKKPKPIKVKEPKILKFTKEEVMASAKNYNTRRDWKKDSPHHYDFAYRHKFIDECTSHMVRAIKVKELNSIKAHFVKLPKILKFTKEEVMASAKNYNTRRDWNKGSPHHYDFAYRHKFIDECTSHMERLGSKSHRCIYFIKIPIEKSIYVGLTFDFKKRIIEHMNTERFKKFIRIYGKRFIETEKATDYLEKHSAARMEQYFINFYRKEGWKLLNNIKGGGLGGKQTKWTEEAILKNILNYNSYKEWVKNETGAYAAALDLNIIEKIDKILPRTPGSFKIWTEEKVLIEAKRWKSRSEFLKYASGAYEAAKKYGIYEEATAHMPDKRLKRF
jgi:predicted GIY-YIG superfamily endonuclease